MLEISVALHEERKKNLVCQGKTTYSTLGWNETEGSVVKYELKALAKDFSPQWIYQLSHKDMRKTV